MLPRIRPMRLRLVKEPFDHPDYIFELKFLLLFKIMSWTPDGCDRLSPGSAYASNGGPPDRQVANFCFRKSLLGSRNASTLPVKAALNKAAPTITKVSSQNDSNIWRRPGRLAGDRRTELAKPAKLLSVQSSKLLFHGKTTLLPFCGTVLHIVD